MTTGIAYACDLVHEVCCLAGSPSFLDDLRDEIGRSGVKRAVKDRDTPVLFDWLIEILSFQGISDLRHRALSPETARFTGQISLKRSPTGRLALNFMGTGFSTSASIGRLPRPALSPPKSMTVPCPAIHFVMAG